MNSAANISFRVMKACGYVAKMPAVAVWEKPGTVSVGSYISMACLWNAANSCEIFGSDSEDEREERVKLTKNQSSSDKCAKDLEHYINWEFLPGKAPVQTILHQYTM